MKSYKDKVINYLESWADFYEDCCVNDNLSPCKFIENHAKMEVLRDAIRQIGKDEF